MNSVFYTSFSVYSRGIQFKFKVQLEKMYSKTQNIIKFCMNYNCMQYILSGITNDCHVKEQLQWKTINFHNELKILITIKSYLFLSSKLRCD